MRPDPTAQITVTKHEPRVFSFSGVDGTDHFLNIPPTLTDTQERNIIAQLRTVIRGTPFWCGDVAQYFRLKAELAARKEADLARTENRKPKEQADFADVLAEAWDISAGHIRNAATICAFFPISCRHEKLTFRHHVDAMRAAGGSSGSLDKAREWLKEAASKNWSCADLREKALPPPTLTPPSPSEDNPFLQLDSADKWATQHKDEVKSITPERAANLLTRMQALAEFIDQLRAIVGAR